MTLSTLERSIDNSASATQSARDTRRLWACGAAIALLTLGFAWRYPLAGNYTSLTDIGKLSRYAWLEFAGFAAGSSAWFGCYILALRASRRLPAVQAMPAIFGCAAFMALGMYWMYPVNAIDIFLYAVRSRVLSSYGANPSAIPFGHYSADPWMAYITPDWAARVSPYGPLWNLLAAPITALAGDQIVIALVGLKVLMVLALLAGGWVIARALAAAGSTRIASGALLYLWNPIVLWEGIGNGHNDLLLTLVLLLALYAWAARRDRLVIPLLVVAALIKYVSLPLIPLATIAIWRRAEDRRARAETIGWSVLLSVIAILITLYPFYDLRAIWNSLHEQGAMFYTSPAAAAIALLNQRYPFDQLAWAATWAGRALLLLAALWQAALVWRRPAHLPRACFEVLFVLLLVAMPSARSWYVIWLVGLAALLPWGWPAWRAIAWSAGALASYALMIWIEAWWQPGYDTMQIVAVPVILGGTLLISLAELAARARRRQQGKTPPV